MARFADLCGFRELATSSLNNLFNDIFKISTNFVVNGAQATHQMPPVVQILETTGDPELP